MATGFSYGGPSVGAAFVTGVFNEQLAVAQNRLELADRYTTEAIGAITSAPYIGYISTAATVGTPSKPSLDGFSPAEMSALYSGTSDEIKAMLAEGLTTFFTDYFPLGNEMVAAQVWIQKALTTGGTGLAPAIEDQIWQRDRARLLKEAARASNEVMSKWAARGYALPPGALVGQVARIDQDARDKIAQASRDRAIQAAQMELENIKFAIEKAISLRVAAIQASAEYLRTLALGPQLGVQLATSMVDAKAKMAQAVTAAYQAEISALELPVRLAISDATNNVDIAKANIAAEVSVIESRTRTIQAAAQSVGVQASAALNALHAQAGFSASEQV